MNIQNNAPCAEWAEKLALLHSDDLSPVERSALDVHVASCPACFAMMTQYAELAALLRDLSVDEVPEEVPLRLAALWEEEQKLQQARAPLPISGHQTRPGRDRRVRPVAVLAAALLVVVVLGTTITYLVSVRPGNQTSSGGTGNQTSSGGVDKQSSSGSTGLLGPAIIIGRFFTIHQSIIYLAGGNRKLLALRSDNGALQSSYVIGDGRALLAPIIVGNVLYDNDLNTLYALRVSDGSVLWHVAFGNHLAISSPLVADGIVYITTSAVDHQLYALRASDGKVLWHYQTRGVNEELGNLAVGNGIVYAGSNDGGRERVYALGATTGTVLWSRQFQELNGPEFTVNGGVLYVSAGNALFALRGSDGASLWRQRIGNTKDLEATSIAGNMLYTLGNNGYVYAIRLADGNVLWRSKIAESASSSSPLIIMNGTIFVASFGGFDLGGNNSAGGNVYALHANNGRIIWQKHFGVNDIPIMATANGILYVTVAMPPKDMLYALKPADGSIMWSKDVSGL